MTAHVATCIWLEYAPYPNRPTKSFTLSQFRTRNSQKTNIWFAFTAFSKPMQVVTWKILFWFCMNLAAFSRWRFIDACININALLPDYSLAIYLFGTRKLRTSVPIAGETQNKIPIQEFDGLRTLPVQLLTELFLTWIKGMLV